MKIFAKLLAISLFVSFSGPAIAVLPPVAPDTSLGTFTVTYQIVGSAMITTTLEEKTEGGSWLTINDPTNSGSVSLARSPGTYEYRVHLVEVELEDFGYFVSDDYSSIVQVTVTDFQVPPIDIIEDQIGYSYVVRSGHINSDGLLDYFVERTTGDLDNGVISEAILKQQSDGNFSNFFPTTSQLSAARTWSVSNIKISLGDYNLDEVADVVFSNVPDGTIPQILLSSGNYFSRYPASVFPLNDDLQNFYADVAGWMGDENYFADAVTPDVPGYNIQINYLIEVCYLGFGFPLCFSENIKILDFDISLADLGLDDYLGIVGGAPTGDAFKVSPGGVSAAAAGAFISSEIHNLTSDSLAEHGIPTLIGTPAERDYASNKLAPFLGTVNDPQVLRCVVFCGYRFIFGFDSYTIVSWVDTWTPITIAGEFDSTNFSADAFEVSEALHGLFEGGESTVSLSDWTRLGEILSRQQPVPLPTPEPPTFPGPDVEPANDPDAQPRRRFRFGFWGRFSLGLFGIDTAERLNARIRRNKFIYHYTTEAGVPLIAAGGQIVNPQEPFGGDVFFTQAIYPTNKIATELLALCGEPRVGIYVVKLIGSGAGPTTRVQPKLCDDGSNPQGGGWEQIAPSPVNALPLRFIPIIDDFVLPD